MGGRLLKPPAGLRLQAEGTALPALAGRLTLRPIIAIQTAILDGFGEVLGGDGGGMIEVGDGAGDLEDAVVGAGGEAHAADGHFEGAFAGVVESAGVLHGARLFHAGADLARRLGRGYAAQLLEGTEFN